MKLNKSYPGLRSCAPLTWTRWKLFKLMILLCVAGFVYVYLTVTPYRIILDPSTYRETSKAREAYSPGVSSVTTSSPKTGLLTPSTTQHEVYGTSPPATNQATAAFVWSTSGIPSTVLVADKSSLVTNTPVTESSTKSSTESLTESSTKSSTESSTEILTESLTESSTESSTKSSTESLTAGSTESSTESLTESSTKSSTESSTPAASVGNIPATDSPTQHSTVTLTSTESFVTEDSSSHTSFVKSATESFTDYVNDSLTLSSTSSTSEGVSVSLSANTSSSPDLTPVFTQPTTLEPINATTVAPGPAKPLFITSLFTGRLGNQMFIYSALIGIARATNRTAFIKGGTDLEATFQITHLNDSINATGWENVGEASYATFDTKFTTLTPTNKTISGYFQSWRYFQHNQDEVRREYRFKDEISRKALEHLQKLKNENGSSTRLIVGVHVRRGDYLTEYNTKLGYGVPQASYFHNAFRKIRELFPDKNRTFLVASDDLKWCKEALKDPDVRIMPEDSAMVHFAVLANCDHVVLSGGTYGWWAAWLSPGVKIYYSRFIVNGTWLSQGFTSEDYYPPDWIGLDN